ncbi:BZ3500_MvSof-1268-A1-R1_Chr9g10618 [Microbotryum saponariae]|uniref:BZ3500_MvSof-1268-A1-R1_Chr9g10618 protein n=1 Tax=Microbotryum saponariae TaxID=289078 RepID=A0A2X0KUG2_9BASI|nr:BZ3501_MvSof-1269-A2-R1_Chr9g10366 [Microbotryum saponariae]SDA00397.1 BZ3500_MvSof-1268-A1-R1_Chr9g10618 [Microbotryum saponariae]
MGERATRHLGADNAANVRVRIDRSHVISPVNLWFFSALLQGFDAPIQARAHGPFLPRGCYSCASHTRAHGRHSQRTFPFGPFTALSTFPHQLLRLRSPPVGRAREACVAKLPFVIPPTIPVYHQEVRTLFRLDQSLAVFPRRLGFHRLRYLFNNSYITNVVLRLAATRTTIPLRLARVVRRVDITELHPPPQGPGAWSLVERLVSAK